MPGTLRRPSDRIDTRLMSLELGNRHRRRPNIQNHNLIAIHENRRHVPQVLLVPSQPKERRIGKRTLIDNRRVLLVSQIKDPNRTIGGDRSENPSLPPGNIVNLLVMSDELSLHDAALDVPNGARRIDATSTNSLRFDVVPVKGSERSTKLRGLTVVENAERLNRVFTEVPEADEIAGGSEEVGIRVRVRVRGRGRRRVKHELCGRVRMVKGERRMKGLKSKSVRIERENVDTVVVSLEEAADSDAVVVST
jgi:hypothetical protein